MFPEFGGYATPGIFTPACLGGGLLMVGRCVTDCPPFPLIDGGGVMNTAWSGIVWYGFRYGFSS